MRTHSPAAPLAVAAVLALSLATPALALEKGVRAGLNLANFRGDITEPWDTEFRTGFTGGAFVAIPVTPRFSVQVEALYSRKGARVSEGDLFDVAGNFIGTFTSSWTVHVIDVPVLARVDFLPGATLRPHLVAGPAFGVQVDGSFEADVPPGFEADLTDLEPVDLGVVVGAGLVRRTGPVGMVLDVRYSTGLTDLYDIADNAESIHSVFSFTAGIVF